MSEQLHYLTDDKGKRIGVLLNMEEYSRLVKQNMDKDLLIGLSQAELQALAQMMLAPTAQSRLDELLARNAESPLSAEETAELDRLLEQVDQLTILKARARYTLNCQEAGLTAT
ncbi:MAG: hypothetical protein U1F76_04360 [Candidatus Competibacteraceae bacterium]